MPVKNPKCLVIDASIVHAAGKHDALHPVPKLCRDFLNEILKLGHTIMVTNDIEKEWQKHHSEFSLDWYFRMRKRNQVRRVREETQDIDLRNTILAVIEENARAAVTKDMLLLEAAFLADECIASKDDTMRGHFRRAAKQVIRLQRVVWVNPAPGKKPEEAEETDKEDCILWLREGAPGDEQRTLGYL